MRSWLAALLLAACGGRTPLTIEAVDAATGATTGTGPDAAAPDATSDTSETPPQLRPDPLVGLFPTSETFVAEVGASSDPHRFSLANVGDAAAAGPAQVALSGADAADFIITRNDCAAPLAAGGACSVEVVFKPRDAGIKSATLTVAVPAVGMAVAFLQGQASSGDGLVLSPTAFDFGRLMVGLTGSPATFVVRNSGAAPITIIGLDIPADDFTFVTNGCVTRPLEPRGTCMFQVAFRPRSGGRRLGSVLVNTATGVKAMAILTGTAF